MNEQYVEKLVSRKADSKIILLRALVLAAVFLVLYLSIFFLGTLGLLAYGLIAVFLLCWLVYYVFMMTSVEYEFVLVKNELTIDAIYGKNKRKNKQVVDISKCEVIGPTDHPHVIGYHKAAKMKTFDYTSGRGEEPVYLLVAPYGAEMCKVYMEMDDRMLDGMKMAAPGKVKNEK